MPTRRQFLLKIKSRHSWHHDVEDQTPGLIHAMGLQKGFRCHSLSLHNQIRRREVPGPAGFGSDVRPPEGRASSGTATSIRSGSCAFAQDQNRAPVGGMCCLDRNLVTLSTLTSGHFAMWSMLAAGLFNSVLFPAILNA